jgi:glycosyltransferase involved in cell wall biosynthesis
MRKALYQLKRRFMKMQDDRRLAAHLRRNNLFLKRYLEMCRLALEEIYQNDASPLVSVSIPTYNLGKILVERTIPSIVNQTYPNWELVIYGDVCTDNTVELMKKYTDPRIKFHNLKEKVKGTGNPVYDRLQFNGWKPAVCAFNDTSGRWLALFNDDDEFTPDHIEVLLEHALKTNAELVYAKQINVKEDNTREEIGREGFPNGKAPFFQDCVPQRTILMRSYLKPFLFSKIDFITKMGYGADMVFWEQMGLAGVRASYLDKVVAIKHRGVRRAPAVPLAEKTPVAG